MIFPAHPSGRYGRMFSFLPAAKHAEADLISLGDLMLDDPAMPPVNPPRGTMLSGLLYFAQFVDHDLSLDRTPLMISGKIPPEERINYRSAFLDLDSLYGGGPEGSPYLYDLRVPPEPPGNELFLIGKTLGGEAGDLPRTLAGRPILADPRNEENLILAQFHVVMLHFHNRVIEALKDPRAADPKLQGMPRFEQARYLVTWHYQYLILDELLKEVLDSSVLDRVRADYPRRFVPGLTNFFIPVEFALAAFRFGHSMIRNDYIINASEGNVTLDRLLNLNSMSNPPLGQLPDEWIIDWGRFFTGVVPRGGKGMKNSTHALDTRIAKALHHLPGPVPIDTGERPRLVDNLAAMTLLRGARSGLPSGESIADALGLPRLTTNEMCIDQDADTIELLKSATFLNNTPLWFYILQEAVVHGQKKRLGPLGSRIVAETVVGTLVADPESLLNRGAGWTPPNWSWISSRIFPIDRTGKLVRFALDLR